MSTGTIEEERAGPRKYGRRYPWDRWFARRRTTLVRGRDYDVLDHVMAAMVRQAARYAKYSVRVSIQIGDGWVKVTVEDPLE